MARRAENEDNNAVDIYGDMLEAIISLLSYTDLLPAYYVSREWRRAVCQSLLNPSRRKPWLIAYIQKLHTSHSMTRRGYDPHLRLWIDIPTAELSSPLLSVHTSHSKLVYTLTPSKFSFSMDAFHAKWYEIDGPKVWRFDPVVAVIGSDIVIAGGTHDFEENPLAVEIYNSESRQWEMCQSMPDVFKYSAASTWLSVAVSDKKMFLLEKRSGAFSTFNLKTKTWESVFVLRPNDGIFHSVMGFSNNRLVLVGLIGNADNVESLRIWEVNFETFDCIEVGEMPPKMLERIIDHESCWPPSSINISMENDLIYIYNAFYPKEIIFCEFGNAGPCSWESIQNSVVNDENVMCQFTFTCLKVGLTDLQEAFGTWNQKILST